VKWQCRILFLLSFLFIPFYCLSAQELRILTEELPPYSFSDENGRAAGFVTEVVREMVGRTDLTIAGGEIKVLPWARAYQMVRQEENVLLFTVTRTPERDELFKWIGPVAERTIWLWKMKERKDIVITSLRDAGKYRVGDVRGYSTAEYLTNLGFVLDYCNSDEHNFKKLIYGRIDILPALELSAAYHMKQNGRDSDQLEKLIVLDDRYDYYLVLNKETSDTIVSRLHAALDGMKRDGTYESIRTGYLR